MSCGSCSSGQICENGSCISGCSNECSVNGSKQCSGNGYKVCGNYDLDSCLEWSDIASCLPNQTCQNGACVINCTSQSSKQCFDNDIYWFNSCNVREVLYMDCDNSSNTTNYRCNGNWTQRQIISKGCQNGACYNNTLWNDTQNCNSLGKVCMNGTCVACVPGQTQGCKVCNAAGTAWVDNSSKCSGGQICTNGTCMATCTPKTCSNLGYTCGNWSNGCSGTLNCGACSLGQLCQSGKCAANCTNECLAAGIKKCNGTGYQSCGNYDSDSCLEWSGVKSCPGRKTCQNGICLK